ncbi:glycosyltransferase [Hyphococcus flavus]|uniref:Glycosyltransferase n=1 Tax=Hyphococcus flavus TaxID=1866326 RepID=A0AAE9ZK40_9PROT|nr:glycosyltransferase [Hyphococcus flavus]WDI32100.1 glycosyltransferase [Hyphococcus flavus]
MGLLLIIIAVLVATAALFLAAFLLAEVIASLFVQSNREIDEEAGAIAVIMPAHNEANTISASIENIKSSLRASDRLIVVADNCEDNTAEVAMKHDAEVLVRDEPDKRGKGYALQYAVDVLRAAPPAVAVFADADCLFEEGALQRISSRASAAQRPVQALYLMKAPIGASPRLQVAAFAWVFINLVRMSGLQKMFDLTRFTGSGFAAPWRDVEQVEFASGEIVEDLALTFQFVRNGAAPLLAREAVVTSEFPENEEALARQNARWSLGSLRYSARSFLSLVAEGIKGANIRMIGAAVDLLIPPLTVFIVLLLLIWLYCLGIWLITGFSAAAVLAFWSIILTGLSVLIGWIAFGRETLPPSALGGAIGFLASKLRVFGAEGRKSAEQWTPTRNKDDAEPGA